MPGWEVYAILVVLLALIFFLYLMIRRAVVGFKEGVEQSQRK
jgi:hypothetical protein